jgi:predicted transcriptional regulator
MIKTTRRVQRTSVATQVLAVVLDDPGVNCGDIAERTGINRVAVSNALAFHRREGRIQNLGKHAKGASWYPKGRHPR